jgi:serine/threonine protein kinase
MDTPTQRPLLNGRYRLLEKLGGGGAGVSYLAEDVRDGGQVVVKRLKTELEPATRARWPREATLLRQLDHPRIPRFLDFFEAEVELETLPHLVQTHVPGVDLRAELETRRYTPDAVLDLVEELLEILTYLQDLSPPVLHRDIKPENIIRRSDGALVLIDFGTAIGESAGTFGHTMATGTLGYQALEQIHGRPGPASDVYSLGVVALELLCRRRPGELAVGMGVLDWRRAIPDAPPAVVSLLERMLATEPSDRFASAREALAGVRAARRPPPPRRSPPRVSRPEPPRPAPKPEPPRPDPLPGVDTTVRWRGPFFGNGGIFTLVVMSTLFSLSLSATAWRMHTTGLSGAELAARVVANSEDGSIMGLFTSSPDWVFVTLGALLWWPLLGVLLNRRSELRAGGGMLQIRHGRVPLWFGYRRAAVPLSGFDGADIVTIEDSDAPNTWQVHLSRGGARLQAVTQPLSRRADADRIAAFLARTPR